MATVTRTVEFTLADYFYTYGFDDGREDSVGYEYRPLAIDIINEILNQAKLLLSLDSIGKGNFFCAEELELCSSHNDCRIDLVKVSDSGADAWLDLTSDDGEVDTLCTNAGKHHPQLAECLRAAAAAFETAIAEREAR